MFEVVVDQTNYYEQDNKTWTTKVVQKSKN